MKTEKKNPTENNKRRKIKLSEYNISFILVVSHFKGTDDGKSEAENGCEKVRIER